ncbi:MAG: lysine--tRNA ligase [Candidatus Thermoplasmatota archaeon]|nr:lysine--tRNA ligase [Euryarchaeota archaeon]MBU4032717.1 lysine--tRNA ligase [Candidatus Thermoplasmatota archaeon]MBU4071298.1 lysine--tRNA ligase [Candidatus Thermoplasmatota archaeon]MBU4143407.1 lysine--tRNA ligase [Candidatus Thermoplasmatota archaeon]MBU4592202.1 lysine--tRNA ligase [Candidatus Thermoplasmatota archaeon]
MHWVDVYAEQLLGRGKKHFVESGTSISGEPHLGSAEDLIISDGIAKAIIAGGGECKTIWAMDDLDGLRKIPPQLPKEFEQYLGQPAYVLPCPDGCCDSFADHFTRPFLENLERIDVRPEPVSVAQMYRDGKYDEVVKIALDKAAEITAIIKEVSGSERDDNWLPFFAICENCGCILTTQAYAWDGQKVSYRCKGGTAGKNFIPGCGHEGQAGIRQGKLPWRVEWAARWSHLGVTFEPMGKDLMAAGGTYETGKAICEQIFNSPAPLAVPYEWIVTEGGKRLGKSVGRVLTIGEFVDIATPEIARYFFIRSNPTSHKDVDFGLGIMKLAEEYETAERAYFGLETGLPEKEIEDVGRNYEISQISGVPETFSQVSYSHLISTVQVSRDWDHILETLSRTDNLSQMTPEHERRLKIKVNAVKVWLATHAPEDMVFQLQIEPPATEISELQKYALDDLLDQMKIIDWTPDKIHNAIHENAVSHGIKAGDMFKLMYRIFLNHTKGPRLGYFLASLDQKFVTDRIKHFSEPHPEKHGVKVDL